MLSMRSHKGRALLHASVAAIILACSESSLSADDDDATLRSELQLVLDEYKTGILSVDGARAYEALSHRSREFWEKLHRATLTYDRQAISDSPFAVKMSVLGARAMVDREILLNGSARDMFVALVSTKQLGYRSVESMGFAHFRLNGSVVTAEVAANGKPTGAYLMEFVKEQGNWKLNTVPLLKAGGEMLASMANKQGMDEEDFIVLVIEQESGKEVDSSIYDPVVSIGDSNRSQLTWFSD